MSKNVFLETKQRDMCYGCKACAHFCPTRAIVMEEDERGFSFPNVKKELCINCGKCEKVCPVSIDKLNSQIIYQAVSKNDDDVLSSQCGAMFTVLSDYVLENHGSVYGVIIDDSFSVKYVRTDNLKTRNKMRGSKYVEAQFDLGLYDEIENDIKHNKQILFVGTPCQCAAIKKNYSKYDNLFVVDFICHGKPSHLFWLKYLESKQKTMNISKIVFRNKRCLGKGAHTLSLFDLSGTEHLFIDYNVFFYGKYAHRDSCFKCQFASLERCSDITIGGYLEKSDFPNEHGSSMLMINTDKGGFLFDKVKSDLKFVVSKNEHYYGQPCLYHPVAKPENYCSFWEELLHFGYDSVIKNADEKYGYDSITQKYHLSTKKEQ